MKFGIRELIFIALLTAIPIASWWLIFRPQNANAEEMRQQIEAKQSKLRELNRATGTIGDLRKRIAGLEDAMKYFRSKLPSEKEIDKVLQEVWELAESNHLQTKSIRTLNRESRASQAGTQGYSEQPISVSLEGNFLGFYSFLQALENQPRIMQVLSMKLTKPPTGPEGYMNAEFTMTIFFEGQGGT